MWVPLENTVFLSSTLEKHLISCRKWRFFKNIFMNILESSAKRLYIFSKNFQTRIHIFFKKSVQEWFNLIIWSWKKICPAHYIQVELFMLQNDVLTCCSSKNTRKTQVFEMLSFASKSLRKQLLWCFKRWKIGFEKFSGSEKILTIKKL